MDDERAKMQDIRPLKILILNLMPEKENIFIMDDERAKMQDIRPVKILILSLMPEKEKTETHLLRLLGNTSLQVNISFLKTVTYESKHTSPLHLEEFYTTFSEVKDRK